MGIFSSIKDLFISSNKELISSHQNHMKNVEKSGIKVIEIQRKGTESTVVEIPAKTSERLEEYAKQLANDLSIQEGSLPDRLKPLVYRVVLWGIRDLQFYEEFQGKSTHFDKLVISLSKNTVNIAILLGGVEYSIAYFNNYFNHFPEYLNNYVLPFEDRAYFNKLLVREKELLTKSDVTIVWSITEVQVFGISDKPENPYKGKYYIYDSQLGVYSNTGLKATFLPYGREDWKNLLAHGYHLDSEEQAKLYLENVIKPKIRMKGGKTGDLQILSSARVYSEVQKLRNNSLNN